jgi:hypothetical protein
MGATQCVVCMYLPLWINEFAPANQKTSWMSYQQASVPFGVMMGYILASFITTFVADPHDPMVDAPLCYGILCWRWPFLIEVVLLTPFCLAIFLVPREHVIIRIGDKAPAASSNKSDIGLVEASPRLEEDVKIATVHTPLNSVKQRLYSDHDASASSPSPSGRRPSHSSVDNAESELPSSLVDQNAYIEMKSVLSQPSIGNSLGSREMISPETRGDHTIVSTMKAHHHHESDDESDDGTYNPHLQAEERTRKRRLRRHSMTASMVDPFYTRNVVRPSYDDLPTLESSPDLLSMLPNLNWSSMRVNTSADSSMRDLEAGGISDHPSAASKPSTPKKASTSTSTPETSTNPWSWRSPLSLPWIRSTPKKSLSVDSAVLSTPPMMTGDNSHQGGPIDEESRGRSDSNLSEPSLQLHDRGINSMMSSTINSRTVNGRSNSDGSVDSFVSSPSYTAYGANGHQLGSSSSSAAAARNTSTATASMSSSAGSTPAIAEDMQKSKASRSNPKSSVKQSIVYTSLREVAKQR